MKANFSSFAAGLVFGVGLLVSGMTQPDKVIGFLNPVENWQPALAFVMVGAIGAHMAVYRWILRRPSPLYGISFGIPTRRDIDLRLVAGAALFGLGWGLGGFCPGPGLVSAASGSSQALVFVASMSGGMVLFHALDAQWKRRSEVDAEPVGHRFPVSPVPVRSTHDA